MLVDLYIITDIKKRYEVIQKEGNIWILRQGKLSKRFAFIFFFNSVGLDAGETILDPKIEHIQQSLS